MFQNALRDGEVMSHALRSLSPFETDKKQLSLCTVNVKK